MEGEEKEKLIARAQRLEGKMLFVKAADAYIAAGREREAASAFEKGSAFYKACALFKKLGMDADAKRCSEKRDAGSSGRSWQDEQADFQKDAGNPY